MRAELVGEGDLVRRLTAIMREHGLPDHVDRFTVTVEPFNVVRVSCDFVAHAVDCATPDGIIDRRPLAAFEDRKSARLDDTALTDIKHFGGSIVPISDIWPDGPPKEYWGWFNGLNERTLADGMAMAPYPFGTGA